MSDTSHDFAASEIHIEQLRARLNQLERECQRRAEKSFSQSEEFNRRLLQAMPGGLVQVAADGRIVSANAQAQRILGLSYDQLLQRYVADFAVMTIREDGSPCPVEEYPVSRCLRSGKAQPSVTIGIRHPNGQVIWGDFAAAPLTDPNLGQVTGAVVTFLDVTERKAIEEAHHASEQRYRRLVEGVRLIAWEFEPTTRQFTFVSSHAEEILGYQVEQWNESGFWFMHLHPEDRDRAAAFSREQVALKKDHEFEYRMLHANGQAVWVKDITTVRTRGDGTISLQGVFVDITEQRQAQEALRQSEQRFRLAAEAVHGMIYDWDANTNAVYRSAGMTKLLGVGPSQANPTIEWWNERIHPDDVQAVLATVNAAMSAAPGYDLEYRVRHADGHYVHVWDRGLFVRDHTGAVVRCVGNTVDISHRKNSEAVLRRHAELIEQIHDAVVETTLDGVVVKWSKGAERIFGYSPQEAIGRHISFVYFPEELRRRQELVVEPLLAKSNHEVELRIRQKSGESRFIHLSLVLMDDNPGAAKTIVGYAMDVTEQRQAEEALRRNEQRLRAILQNSPAAVFMKDVAGRYVEFNRQAEIWTGRTRNQVIGKTDHEIFPAEVANAFIADDQKILTKGRSIEVEETLPHLDGPHVHFTVKFPLADADGVIYAICGISTDITERRRAEEARRQSTELQRLMLSELDHRVRNNLASLAALIDISMRDQTDVREFAASIRGRVQAMSSVHSLLSRGHWIAVDLRSLIETLKPQDLQGSIVLEGPDVKITPRQVTAMGMVLQELMANSLKYGAMQSPGGVVELKWTMASTSTLRGIPFELTWTERGGRSIESAPTPGQGTSLIQGFVRTELRGSVELSYPRNGALHCFLLHLDPVNDGR